MTSCKWLLNRTKGFLSNKTLIYSMIVISPASICIIHLNENINGIKYQNGAFTLNKLTNNSK